MPTTRTDDRGSEPSAKRAKLSAAAPSPPTANHRSQQREHTVRQPVRPRKSTRRNETRDVAPEDITVAIFCALVEESVAVRYSLDETLTCRTVPGQERYVYSFGRIGNHNLVIARPTQMGLVDAAQCAATVSQQFANVRIALMVGIGAAIPSPEHEIRLVDIAVSIPQGAHPGVITYDFGKYESNGNFVRKGSLNTPPRILLAADGSLQEDEIMGKKPLNKILRHITKRAGYGRPTTSDILFADTYPHREGTCEKDSAEGDTKAREKRLPSPGQPVVHRGLIMSGSGVVKNPGDRDRLRRGYREAIWFEMEAGGIMNEIPCSVIRGICDYADTHKQDGWHYYAAAVAAAYCKAVLLKVHGDDMGKTITMREAMDECYGGTVL